MPGKPVPQGSKSVFRGRLVEANKALPGWRRAVTAYARQANAKAGLTVPFDVPIWAVLEFSFLRPPSHLTSRGALRKGVSEEHVQKPDLDKLVRAVLDALTVAGTLCDDSRVVSITASKDWSLSHQGVSVTLSSSR